MSIVYIITHFVVTAAAVRGGKRLATKCSAKNTVCMVGSYTEQFFRKQLGSISNYIMYTYKSVSSQNKR